ncbi:beta-lactamase family protein [Neobacillus mesonae]|nr:beta-lactamase family protein [Neobacillus mesonae]
MNEQLNQLIEEYSKDHMLSGNILITHQGRELFSKSYGQASYQLGVLNHMDTKFHIASVTKMFIAAAVLKLFEQGQMDLEAHPGKYIEKFSALHPEITIHHLLSHSSGLKDIYALPNLRFEMNRLNLENREFIDYLVRLDQEFNPGERWGYSSSGFIILGYILEALNGMKYEQVLQEWFFSPLHMESTGIDDPRKINLGRAYGHSIEHHEMMNSNNDKLSEIEAPGELYSTVHDLDKWCNALFSGELLNQHSIDMMFKPYYVTSFDPLLNYGYGCFLRSDNYLIGGGTPGFRSEIWHYPAHDLRIIMLWNVEQVDSHRLFWRLKPALDDVLVRGYSN